MCFRIYYFFIIFHWFVTIHLFVHINIINAAYIIWIYHDVLGSYVIHSLPLFLDGQRSKPALTVARTMVVVVSKAVVACGCGCVQYWDWDYQGTDRRRMYKEWQTQQHVSLSRFPLVEESWNNVQAIKQSWKISQQGMIHKRSCVFEIQSKS